MHTDDETYKAFAYLVGLSGHFIWDRIFGQLKGLNHDVNRRNVQAAESNITINQLKVEAAESNATINQLKVEAADMKDTVHKLGLQAAESNATINELKEERSSQIDRFFKLNWLEISTKQKPHQAINPIRMA